MDEQFCRAVMSGFPRKFVGDLGAMWDGSGICTGIWFEGENDPPVTRDVKVQPQAIPNHGFLRGGLW